MTRVAVLGPLGTYTHQERQAAVSYFGPSVALEPHESITAAFEALLAGKEAGDITHAVLPLENSSFGPVAATQEFLKSHLSDLSEINKVTIKIQHMLMSSPKAKASDLQWITSHEQALGQCKAYLDTHFPKVPRRPSESTASAALYARDHPEAAAICSQLAGQLFDLAILDAGPADRGIQDAGLTNHTTFGVFTKREAQNQTS